MSKKDGKSSSSKRKEDEIYKNFGKYDEDCECKKCGKQGPPGPRGERGPQGPQGEPGPQGPSGTPKDAAYGFAYSSSKSTSSGAVQFRIAGPLNDVVLTPNGLQVLRDGIFQISYKVIAILEEENSQVEFQVVINNSINVVSSKTLLVKNDPSTETRSTLSSSVIFSLLAGDLVQLSTVLPEKASYDVPTIQVMQID